MENSFTWNSQVMREDKVILKHLLLLIGSRWFEIYMLKFWIRYFEFKFIQKSMKIFSMTYDTFKIRKPFIIFFLSQTLKIYSAHESTTHGEMKNENATFKPQNKRHSTTDELFYNQYYEMLRQRTEINENLKNR